ncbi:hypothetical protein Sru01_55510 [Sphaerisporangium rufum]|uniref:Enterochelin esterase n=1 Tax=Sphaerisporangium rufum TaxID=1381558 RepID=A0A919R6U8_9ACTN|nr:alpha/beta hydrolase-fold protein [Sphaerisporangium rufum]GII80569.1 hypothetical protein Sru01_55510 [Sphaerisporangium rufum]
MQDSDGSLRRGGVRRLPAVIAAGVLAIATMMLAPRPAEAADPPWLTVSADRFAAFSVPAAYIQANLGEVSQVHIEGDFGPSAAWVEYGLTRRGDLWSGVLGPLEPGLYHYQVTADDTKTLKDPTNGAGVASRPLLSTFLVPGDSARLLADAPDGRRGTVEPLAYRTGKEQRTALVWTPPGYSARGGRPYPVLYLRSGPDRAATDWLDLGRAGQILDNLSAGNAVEPMVVVIADGRDGDPGLADLRKAAGDAYRVHRDREHQAVAGVAEGGSQALRAVLTGPGEFAYAGSFSGRPAQIPDLGPAAGHGLKLLRLYTGNVTDPAYNATVELTRALDRAHVRYEFDGVDPRGGGNWAAWRRNLIDFLPRLFRKVAGHGPSAGHGPLRGRFEPPAPGTTPTPAVTKDGFVTFETTTAFTGARHVTVWANIAPGGSWLRVPMARTGDRWRVTVGPLEPWFYYYQWIVDRVGTKDTANPTKVTSEPAWSWFLLPGKRARLLSDVPAGRGGKVESLTYQSTVAGAERTALVWTPPGYDPGRAEKYPVLYLQHGSGQNYTDWTEMGRARQILDHQYLDGDLVPMVVVMGNGNSTDFTRELLENIVPAARARYNISGDPGGQALAGLSMGGAQALGVLKAHPGRFAYVAAFSAGFGAGTGVDAAAVNDGTKMLRMYVGDVTDFAYPWFAAGLATMDELGVRYEFDGITPGPHGWDVWQKNLIDLAPRLFRR